MNAQNSRRGVWIAAIALALVLAGGAAAYAFLVPRQQDSASSAADVSTTATANGNTNDATANGAAAGDAASTNADATASGNATTSSPAASATDVPRLADYDATVYTPSGDKTQLSQIADGKPLVINFWATWCPYCIREFPDYQTLLSEYGDRVSFAFIDAPGNKGETVEKALNWLEQNGYADFPAYFDNDFDASVMFGVRSLPTTVIVSADGVIQGAFAGMIDLQNMRATLDALVS